MEDVLALLCWTAGKIRLVAFTFAVKLLVTPIVAEAVPAYARQTGQNCVACHAGGQFPELTTFGRQFKLGGYALGTHQIPLSVMGIASYTKSRNPSSDAAFAKDAAAIFQTGSVFLAGKITDKSGIFAQATYDNYNSQNPDTNEWRGKWVSDNFDLRYADSFTAGRKDLIAGLSLNNNPTVADPWNTAPAWIQYVPTAFGVTGPDAVPIVAQLGQQVAGISAYALWNQNIYAELSAYKTANGFWSFLSKGNDNADQTKLRGMAPYARLAYTRAWGQHNLMVGMFAMNADVYPNNLDPTGPTISYRDRGVDAQYQYIGDPQTVTAQMSYVHETIGNGDVTGIAANASNSLNQWRLKTSYIYRNKYGASLGYFNTTGSTDNMLYPDPGGNPGTSGWVPEVFWMPEQHVRVGVQYYAFKRFHGASTNYDGAGRNAEDNNTLFIYIWGAY
jgi:hypothetical protein